MISLRNSRRWHFLENRYIQLWECCSHNHWGPQSCKRSCLSAYPCTICYTITHQEISALHPSGWLPSRTVLWNVKLLIRSLDEGEIYSINTVILHRVNTEFITQSLNRVYYMIYTYSLFQNITNTHTVCIYCEDNIRVSTAFLLWAELLSF